MAAAGSLGSALDCPEDYLLPSLLFFGLQGSILVEFLVHSNYLQVIGKEETEEETNRAKHISKSPEFTPQTYEKTN